MRLPPCRPKHCKHRHFVLLTSASKQNQAPVSQDAYLLHSQPGVAPPSRFPCSPFTGYAFDVFILRVTPICAHADPSQTSSGAPTHPPFRQKAPVTIDSCGFSQTCRPWLMSLALPSTVLVAAQGPHPSPVPSPSFAGP
ncbi:hypothetical protein LY78DRAFT_131273 [Colletotrichum sublineola]|nr:hypothetical protein LY78DRAFT_131273 [Colletotrichum sublineola]